MWAVQFVFDIKEGTIITCKYYRLADIHFGSREQMNLLLENLF
jgi:hypothetical protein